MGDRSDARSINMTGIQKVRNWCGPLTRHTRAQTHGISSPAPALCSCTSPGSGRVSAPSQYAVVAVTAMSVLAGWAGENMFVLLNVTQSRQINNHGSRGSLLNGLEPVPLRIIANTEPIDLKPHYQGFICWYRLKAHFMYRGVVWF